MHRHFYEDLLMEEAEKRKRKTNEQGEDAMQRLKCHI